jgi:hypothetical protein
MKYAKGSKEKGLMVMIGIGLSVIAVGGILYAIKDSRAKNKVGDSSDGAVDEPKVDTPQPAKEPAKVPVKAVRSLRGELAGLTNQLDGSKLLVIGDSQVLRSMGQAFLDNVDQSIRAGVDYWGIEGTTPAKIIKRNIEKQTEIGNLLIAKLMKKPPVIVIQLGDNGIMSEQECKRLVLYINSFYPDASKPLIVWSGPFPLCVPSDGSQKYVKGAPCSASMYILLAPMMSFHSISQV